MCDYPQSARNSAYRNAATTVAGLPVPCLPNCARPKAATTIGEQSFRRQRSKSRLHNSFLLAYRAGIND